MRKKTKINPFEGMSTSGSGYKVSRASSSEGYSGGGLIINRGDLIAQQNSLIAQAERDFGYNRDEEEEFDEETEQKLQVADAILGKFGSMENFLNVLSKLDGNNNTEQLNINEVKKTAKPTIKSDDDLINNIMKEI